VTGDLTRFSALILLKYQLLFEFQTENLASGGQAHLLSMPNSG